MSLLGRLTAQAKGWVADVGHRLGWPGTRRIEHRPADEPLEASQPPASRPAPAAPALRFTPPGTPPPSHLPARLTNYPSWVEARRPYTGRFADALTSIGMSCDALIRERALARIASLAGRDKAELRAALVPHSAIRLVRLVDELRRVSTCPPRADGTAADRMDRLLQTVGVPPPAPSPEK